MCIIIDNNMRGRFFKRDDEDMQYIHDWLTRHRGKIAYTTTEKFRKEFGDTSKNSKVSKFKKWLNANPAHRKLIDPKLCANAEKELLTQNIDSNDEHILALAQVGNIKTLCTIDGPLEGDFKRLIRGGRIYKYKTHKHILGKDTCP